MRYSRRTTVSVAAVLVLLFVSVAGVARLQGLYAMLGQHVTAACPPDMRELGCPVDCRHTARVCHRTAVLT